MMLPRFARGGEKKVLDRQASALGVLYRMRLTHAPFPSPPLPWTDRTVLVFVPRGFVASKRVDLAFFLHGNRNTVDSAWRKHQPHAQLVASRKNALMIAPQLAVKASDSRAGKLEKPGGCHRLCAEVLTELEALKVVPAGATSGRLVLGAHSGGFQPAAKCADLGGLDVHEMYFFDAMYGFSRRIGQWLAGGKERRFVSWYAGRLPTRWTHRLMTRLDRGRLSYLHRKTDRETSDADLRDHRIVFVKTQTPHGQVTRNLRRCLETSGLRTLG